MAANTYANGTTISAGSLVVNNTAGSGLGTGAVSVANGATLSGALSTSGTVVPGNGVGFLTVNNNGAFSTDAASFNNLAAGSTSALFNVSFSSATAGQYTGQYQLHLSDQDGLDGSTGGQVLTVNVSAEVVPEPSTLVLALGGLLGWAACLWRKRRAAA